MLPGGYGNSYQIVQGPGFVAIRYEMVHETRVIPLDSRRTSADRVEWSVTVEDSSTWAQPWTFAMPLTRNEDEAVELYECHEGNHAIFNILGAARAAEREQAASQSR